MVEAIFGLVGVVIGSVLAFAKDGITAWVQRKKDGSYAAIRLICILHEYADHCVEVTQDDGTSHGQPAGRTDDGQEFYVAQAKRPMPPEYPDDIAWRSFPNDLMHRILGFPNKARVTNRYIDGVAKYVAEFPDYSELFEARQEGYAKLGRDALELADQLVKKYQIDMTHEADLGAEWDVRAFFRETIAKIETSRKEQAKREASFSLPPLA
ncbi:hypothetical protein [Tritonibacter scottomollicae]|uniref:Uncharacterized protein n=1 Tax=Tritonibacter scottomollicae TaxID=483013 RepID=A0A2T0ZYK9_TRISK|nr:hypothetical protein [Tritonibacter scottomollicae]PRZ41441.1 hypothetical protein CLV89_1475 [Tritonibacter scottomollicae]